MPKVKTGEITVFMAADIVRALRKASEHAASEERKRMYISIADKIESGELVVMWRKRKAPN